MAKKKTANQKTLKLDNPFANEYTTGKKEAFLKKLQKLNDSEKERKITKLN